MVGITQPAIGGGDAGTKGSRQAKPQRDGAPGIGLVAGTSNGSAPGAA
jgi:hypothetical protein